MYELEYLPAALQDMVDIVQYISRELQNPDAASRLAMELTEQGDKLVMFPYAHPTHMPIRQLKHEYRKILVKNYLMFYWVDEETHRITVARVIYARRDAEKILE